MRDILKHLEDHAAALCLSANSLGQQRGNRAQECLDKLLRPMHVALERASRYMLATAPSHAIVSAGLSGCQDFERLWRQEMGQGGLVVSVFGLGEQAGMKPKYHVMESHVAEWWMVVDVRRDVQFPGFQRREPAPCR